MRKWGLMGLLLVVSGCSTGTRGGDSDTIVAEGAAVVSDLTEYAFMKADSVMEGMTLEERVGQLFMPSVYSSSEAGTLTRVREYVEDLHVGGLLLLKGTLGGVAAIDGIVSESRIPLWLAIDAEWGLGMRLENAPDFPKNGKLGVRAGEELLYDYGREVARESRRAGINMVLGPVVDVSGSGKGIIGNRSFGGNPRRVADLGVAYAKGLESWGVVSVAKHFPGHGSPEGDSHRVLPVIDRDYSSLDSIDLYPFRRYVESGLSGVMVGHLAVPALDSLSMPAAVSKEVIGGLLRERLGFRGLVLTDALNMGGAEGYGAVDAIAAGADIVVGPADTRGEIAGVVEGVWGGRISVDVVDDRCRRVLFYKYLLELDRRERVRTEGLEEDVASGAGAIMERMEF